MLNEILRIGDIKKVIWIDDTFSKESKEEQATVSTEQVLDEIRVRIESGDTEILDSVNERLPLQVTLDLDETEESLDTYSECLSGSDDKTLHDVALMLDMVKEQENTVVTLFEKTELPVECFSLRDWEKMDGLADIASTLFLVDKDFSKEGESEDKGLEIAKDILRKIKSYDKTQCVIFTQDVAAREKDENEARKLYIDKNGFSSEGLSGRLMVLAKSRVSDADSAESSLALGLKNSFIRTLLWAIAKGVIEKSVETSKTTLEKISEANIYQVSSVLFESTSEEGGLEIDLIHRIISAEWQDSAASFLLSTPEVIELLARGRQLYGCNPEEKDDSEQSRLESSKELLSTILRTELWHNGDIVNKMHSPIANGDVFEVTETGDRYVLVGQPCELMIRGGGSRKVYDAVFLPIQTKELASKTKAKKFHEKPEPGVFSLFESSSTLVDNGAQVIDLTEPTTINLSFLDLCSFNEDGLLELNENTAPSLPLLTEGLKLRFEKYQDLVLNSSSKDIKKSALSNLVNFPTPLFSDDYTSLAKVELTLEQGCVCAPLKRVERIREPVAEEILAEFYRYKARKAWGSDFLAKVAD